MHAHASPHASTQIAPYPTCECRPTARIVSIRIPRECDADLTSFPPALSLKAQTQAAERSPFPHAMRSAVRLLCSKDSSASGDTLVRNPSERDAPEQKPTPIKPGVWRNKFWCSEGFTSRTGYEYPAGESIGPTRYPTREIAEQKANEWIELSSWYFTVDPIFLGPVFFPSDGEKP